MFEDFIARLLYYYNRYLVPKSVIVIDNSSWHRSRKVRQIYNKVGVILEFLLLYSPDFNPIKEHFGVLKKFIKRRWHENKDFISQEFKIFLKWCVDIIGDDKNIAQNHFRHAGISIGLS